MTTTQTAQTAQTTTVVPDTDLRRFRREVLRAGGHIVQSSPVGTGYSVTYVLPAA